jgi:prevent-host-death family protein
LRGPAQLAKLANVKQVNVHEAKTELSRLLELVEAGERVIIARAGRPVAVLSAYQPSMRKRKLGQFRGQGSVPEDFDDLPAEVARAFEGDEE